MENEKPTEGGLLVGATDKDGGKGIKVLAPEGQILMGGGEIIINEEASTKHCETLSKINQSTGGVAIPCDVQKTANKGPMDDGGKLNSCNCNNKMETKISLKDGGKTHRKILQTWTVAVVTSIDKKHYFKTFEGEKTHEEVFKYYEDKGITPEHTSIEIIHVYESDRDIDGLIRLIKKQVKEKFNDELSMDGFFPVSVNMGSLGIQLQDFYFKTKSGKNLYYNASNAEITEGNVKSEGGRVGDDPDAIREIELFLENDEPLYRQSLIPIRKNLMTKLAQGKFSADKAPALFKYAVEAADKKYQKEFGTPGRGGFMLSVKDRKILAESLAKDFLDNAKSGEYDEYIPAKYQGKPINYPDASQVSGIDYDKLAGRKNGKQYFQDVFKENTMGDRPLENALMMAQIFGTELEVSDVKNIMAISKKKGKISKDDEDEIHIIINKYKPQLFSKAAGGKLDYEKFKEGTSVKTTVYMSEEDTGGDEIKEGIHGIVTAEPSDEEELVGVVIKGQLHYLPQDVLEIISKAEGGKTDDYSGSSLNSVEVIFENPEYNYTTSVSAQTTEEDAKKYFVGKSFNVGKYPKEQFEKVIGIKYTPAVKMAKGGKVKPSKFEVGDMVYSWQNPDYPARICFKDFRTWLNNGEPHENDTWHYKVTLKDKEGYTRSSKWMGEDSLFKEKQKRYASGGKTGNYDKEIDTFSEGKYFFEIDGKRGVATQYTTPERKKAKEIYTLDLNALTVDANSKTDHVPIKEQNKIIDAFLEGYYKKHGKAFDKKMASAGPINKSFKIGDVVWDKEHKTYGTILNNYGNDTNGDHGDVRLDSDGNQPISNLVHVGEEGDAGNGDLTELKASAERIIKSAGSEEQKTRYNNAYKRLLAGEFDNKKMARGGKAFKEVAFPNCNLYLYGQDRDINGNSVVKVGFPNDRAFSIQTNGVLPETQYILDRAVSEVSNEELKEIEWEVVNYVKKYGSANQKKKLKTYSGFSEPKYNKGGKAKDSEKVLKVKSLLKSKGIKSGEVSPNFVNDFANENGITDLTSEEVVKISDTYAGGGKVEGTVQALIFDRAKFSKASASKWAKEHKYAAKYFTAEQTGTHHKLRQVKPNKFKPSSLKTVDIADGVQAVTGQLRANSKQK